jgi:hypothetical protein
MRLDHREHPSGPGPGDVIDVDHDTAHDPNAAGSPPAVAHPPGVMGGRNGMFHRTGLTAIHGLKYRKWQYVHTFGVVLGTVAAAAGLLKNKYGEAPRPAEK